MESDRLAEFVEARVVVFQPDQFDNLMDTMAFDEDALQVLAHGFDDTLAGWWAPVNAAYCMPGRDDPTLVEDWSAGMVDVNGDGAGVDAMELVVPANGKYPLCVASDCVEAYNSHCRL